MEDYGYLINILEQSFIDVTCLDSININSDKLNQNLNTNIDSNNNTINQNTNINSEINSKKNNYSFIVPTGIIIGVSFLK